MAQSNVGETGVIARLFAPGAQPRTVALAELPSHVRAKGTLIWVDLCASARGDLYTVAELLDLPHDTVQAALAPGTHLRVDRREGHLFVSVPVPCLGVRAVDAAAYRLDLFVGRNYLVSVHRWPLPFAPGIHVWAGEHADLSSHDAISLLDIVLDDLLAYTLALAHQVFQEGAALQERALRETSASVMADLLRVKRAACVLARLLDQYRVIYAVLPASQLGTDMRTLAPGAETQARLADQWATLQAALEAVDSAFMARTAARANRYRAGLVLAGTMLALIAAALMAIVLLVDAALPWGAATTPAGALGLAGRILIRAAFVGIMALCLLWWRRWLWADQAGPPASGERRCPAAPVLPGHAHASGRPGRQRDAATGEGRERSIP